MIGIDNAATLIVEHYGHQKQEIQAVQELSELILLLAARPDQRHDDYRSHLTEEIADSLIMIEQIRIANGITDIEVQEWIEKKINRQFCRMRNEVKT